MKLMIMRQLADSHKDYNDDDDGNNNYDDKYADDESTSHKQNDASAGNCDYADKVDNDDYIADDKDPLMAMKTLLMTT